MAEKFKSSQPGTAEVSVKFSGTSGGFREFCAGKTDISNASRPIQADEMSLCNRYGVRYIELPVAFDALTVVVNQENNWIDSITLEELKKMWEPAAEGKITNWNQIRPEFPNKPLNLFGAGQDSGTFDYFTEAVVGKSGASRKDYVASEDDNTLVQGVSQYPNALGYFGLAYFDILAAVKRTAIPKPHDLGFCFFPEGFFAPAAPDGSCGFQICVGGGEGGERVVWKGRRLEN